MTYLIINVYDSAWGFSVCENGKVYDKDKNYEKRNFYKNIYLKTPDYNYKAEYAKLDFDFIVLCEDGNTEILKGGN